MVSSAEPIGAFNTGFEPVNLHRSTLAVFSRQKSFRNFFAFFTFVRVVLVSVV
jgi:hypothetical protein